MLWVIIILSCFIQSIKFMLHRGIIAEKNIKISETISFAFTIAYYVLLFSFFTKYLFDIINHIN